MFFIIRFTVEWIVWILFADKKRWRELFPVAFFASLIGSVTDNIMHHHKLWSYENGRFLFSELADDFGTYIVVTYLFIQWLPKRKTFWKMFGYWFIWTGVAVGIEWFHVVTKHIEHHNGWSLWYSYFFDWFLFWIFYQYHKIFKFEILSEK